MRASRPGWKAKSNSSRVLWWGSPDSFKRVAEPAALAQPDLFLQEQVDEVEVAHLRGFGAVDELGEGVGEVGEAEPGGVGADPVGGQGAHQGSPSGRCRRGCR